MGAQLIAKLPWLALFGLGLGADQWTKRWIVDRFQEYQIQPVTGWFNLTRMHNEGAAFSFLADAGGWQKPFFITLASVVSLVVAVWLWRLPAKGHKLLSAGLALILSGAIGNVIDRIAYGHVIDFLDVYYQDWHWPAFNVADSCIFVGAALVILDAIANGDRDSGR